MSVSRPSQPPTTSVTLLGRLRDPADEQAWHEFDRRYRTLIVRFLRSRGLQVADAEDTAQIVLTKLVTGLRAFEYDASKGGFRAYLFRCTRSGLSDFFLRQDNHAHPVSLETTRIAASANSDPEAERAFEREWVEHHYRLAVERYRVTAENRAAAILDATLAGRSVKTIAEDLAMNEAAVHKAQQRLRDRLRELIAEQLRDEEDPHERPSE